MKIAAPNTVHEALELAFVWFAQAFGALWQPPPGSLELWAGLLGDLSPKSIAMGSWKVAKLERAPSPEAVRRHAPKGTPSTCSPASKRLALDAPRKRWSELTPAQQQGMERWQPKRAAEMREREERERGAS